MAASQLRRKLSCLKRLEEEYWEVEDKYARLLASRRKVNIRRVEALMAELADKIKHLSEEVRRDIEEFVDKRIRPLHMDFASLGRDPNHPHRVSIAYKVNACGRTLEGPMLVIEAERLRASLDEFKEIAGKLADAAKEFGMPIALLVDGRHFSAMITDEDAIRSMKNYVCEQFDYVLFLFPPS